MGRTWRARHVAVAGISDFAALAEFLWGSVAAGAELRPLQEIAEAGAAKVRGDRLRARSSAAEVRGERPLVSVEVHLERDAADAPTAAYAAAEAVVATPVAHRARGYAGALGSDRNR